MRYRRFDLETFNYKNENRVESYSVRVLDSPYGEQKYENADVVIIPDGLRQRLRMLENRDLDQSELIALGETLGEMLFPRNARTFLENSRASIGEEQRLRIRLKLNTCALANIPWEYVYLSEPGTPAGQKDPYGFLALDSYYSIVRYEMLASPRGKLTPVGDDRKIKHVTILADPGQDYPALNLTGDKGEEERIRQRLGKLNFLNLAFYPDATVNDLMKAISEDTHVFHFAGHGEFESDMGTAFGSREGRGYLILMNEIAEEEKKYRKYPSDKLSLILKRRGVRLAMLGACETGRRDQVNVWTGIVPALTRAGIPAVIGMQYKIVDHNAIAFTSEFYEALAKGKPLDEAVTVGRVAIVNNSQNEKEERDWGVPVLYLRTDDTEEGVLFPELITSSATTATPLEMRRGEVSMTFNPVVAGAEGLREVYSQPGNPPGSMPNQSAGPTAAMATRASYATLRRLMEQHFSEEDLKMICFDLGIPYETNGNKMAKVIAMIEYCSYRNLLHELVEKCREERSFVSWPNF